MPIGKVVLATLHATAVTWTKAEEIAQKPRATGSPFIPVAAAGEVRTADDSTKPPRPWRPSLLLQSHTTQFPHSLTDVIFLLR